MHFYLLGDNQKFVKYFNQCGISIVNRYLPPPKLHIVLKKIDVADLRKEQKI